MFYILLTFVQSLTICSPLEFCNTTEPTCVWLKRNLTWRYPLAPTPDVEETTSKAFAFWEKETDSFRFFKSFEETADVEFFLLDDPFASYTKNRRVFLNLRAWDSYATIVHQIGHVLGLPDNERVVDSVMFDRYERKTENYSLHPSDVDSLDEIYDGVCSRTYDSVTMTNECLLVGIKGESYRSFDTCENEISSAGKLSDVAEGHGFVRSVFRMGKKIAVISPWDLLYVPGEKVLDLRDLFEKPQRVTVGLEIAERTLLFFTEDRTVWVFSKTDYFRRNLRIEDLFDYVPFYEIIGAYVTDSSIVSLITENYERWVYRDYKLVERKDLVLEYPSLFCENFCTVPSSTTRRVFAIYLRTMHRMSNYCSILSVVLFTRGIQRKFL